MSTQNPIQRRWMASSGGGGVIRGGRRRPSGSSSGPRERADAPQRQTPGGGGTAGGGSGGGGRLPFGPTRAGGQRSCLGTVGGLVFLIILVVIFGPSILTGGDGAVDQPVPDQQEELAQPQVQSTPRPTRVPATAAPRPTRAASGGSSGDTWTVMMYQDADDKILEQDIFLDLNEAERVGSSDKVKIVAQMDRFRGAYSGDGNWTGARRFLITRDDDLNALDSEVVDDLGEVNMADGQTLVDFVTWAMETYPADKYALILSDHGLGWPGGWSDSDSSGRQDDSTPLQAAAGDQIYLNELDSVLEEIRSQTGLDAFELVGMDACLMGHLEVLSTLVPHARYAVLSQETEPSLGWAYTTLLQALVDNPAMDGAELGQVIVDSYIVDDQRIQDEQARAEFMRQGSGMNSLFGAPVSVSAGQLANQLGAEITLSTIDLAQIPEVMSSLNNLAYQMQSVDQQAVAKARNFSRSFTSIFGDKVPASYIDLANFVQLLQDQSGDSGMVEAGDRVLNSISQAVLANKTGPKRRGANGISIYFPNSTVYRTPISGPQSYTGIAERFSGESLWDDFLAFHYTDRPFKADDSAAVVPQRGAAVTGPGSEAITVSEIQLSSDTASPGNPTLLSAEITGQNVGYIYLFAGFRDRASGSVAIVDMDYIESPNTREVNGVFYPVWSENNSFTLEFEWEPLAFALSNGQEEQEALLRPESYGSTPEEAVYTVDGYYTYADSGDRRYARLYMADGQLIHVYGFTNDDGTGAPREIVPNPGDSFTILEQWLDPGASGEPMTMATQEGGTLAFEDGGFTWVELDAAAGEYVVGFIVEDLDGNRYESFAEVTVR